MTSELGILSGDSAPSLVGQDNVTSAIWLANSFNKGFLLVNCQEQCFWLAAGDIVTPEVPARWLRGLYGVQGDVGQRSCPAGHSGEILIVLKQLSFV